MSAAGSNQEVREFIDGLTMKLLISCVAIVSLISLHGVVALGGSRDLSVMILDVGATRNRYRTVKSGSTIGLQTMTMTKLTTTLFRLPYGGDGRGLAKSKVTFHSDSSTFCLC